MSLSEQDARQFANAGWLKVSGAIPGQAASDVCAYLNRYVTGTGTPEDETFVQRTTDFVQIKSEFSGGLFDACMTPRLKSYLDDLTSPYLRTADSDRGHWGWWSINLRYGADQPWGIPHDGWHWDGAQFRHSVASCHNVGILMLCLFSDVENHGGATLLAEGSHRAVLSVLDDAGKELDLRSALRTVRMRVPWIGALTSSERVAASSLRNFDRVMNRTEAFSAPYYDPEFDATYRVIQATGSAGDVYLCHPYLLHAASFNHKSKPRFLCNRFAPFLGPLKHYSDLSESKSILDFIAATCATRHHTEVSQ